jgi:PIN domain nuclease of toxin-antitoxin system
VILQTNKKLKVDFTIDKLAKIIEYYNFTIISTEPKHIKALEKLPVVIIDGKKHDDPFDRLLIAQSISEKFTIISSDLKFPFYTNFGLKLLENE